jgi:alpha-galactosidase
MLEVGNGRLSSTENRSHMSLWAMMAAPLLIGTDLRRASDETLAILSNPELIAIDQDPLGIQATPVLNAGGTMVLDKPLASGEHAILLYNSTDEFARVAVPASRTGLPAADAYRLVDVWTGSGLETGPLIAAGVAPHGTVVYRVGQSAGDELLAPAVAVGGTLDTLLAGLVEGATLTASVENLGLDAAADVAISVTLPMGWDLEELETSSLAALPSGESFATTFNVYAPEGTTPGRYPLGLSVSYGADGVEGEVTVTSELSVVVVGPPPDGVTHLSQLVPLSSANGLGPVEIDMSNGAAAAADGNLLTIDGHVYTRGLGTESPSELVYFLGGRCSTLSVDVGIDDEVGENGAATFVIQADDEAVVESDELSGDDGSESLSADVTGATWLRLVTMSDGSTSFDRADWAMPLLRCGKSSEPSTPELTLFSFEAGDEGWTAANSSPGGTVAPSSSFYTDGQAGLEVVAPTDGNWFGRRLAEPLDLSAFSRLKVDLKTGAAGTSGEFALQLGSASSWCQGSLWTWTNANRTVTLARSLDELACPAGASHDLTQVRAVWVFLKGGTFQIDNVRAE